MFHQVFQSSYPKYFAILKENKPILLMKSNLLSPWYNITNLRYDIEKLLFIDSNDRDYNYTECIIELYELILVIEFGFNCKNIWFNDKLYWSNTNPQEFPKFLLFDLVNNIFLLFYNSELVNISGTHKKFIHRFQLRNDYINQINQKLIKRKFNNIKQIKQNVICPKPIKFISNTESICDTESVSCDTESRQYNKESGYNKELGHCNKELGYNKYYVDEIGLINSIVNRKIIIKIDVINESYINIINQFYEYFNLTTSDTTIDTLNNLSTLYSCKISSLSRDSKSVISSLSRGTRPRNGIIINGYILIINNYNCYYNFKNVICNEISYYKRILYKSQSKYPESLIFYKKHNITLIKFDDKFILHILKYGIWTEKSYVIPPIRLYRENNLGELLPLTTEQYDIHLNIFGTTQLVYSVNQINTVMLMLGDELVWKRKKTSRNKLEYIRKLIYNLMDNSFTIVTDITLRCIKKHNRWYNKFHELTYLTHFTDDSGELTIIDREKLNITYNSRHKYLFNYETINCAQISHYDTVIWSKTNENYPKCMELKIMSKCKKFILQFNNKFKVYTITHGMANGMGNFTAMECIRGKGANFMGTECIRGKGANFMPMECTMGKGANSTAMECTPGKGANFMPMECTSSKDTNGMSVVEIKLPEIELYTCDKNGNYIKLLNEDYNINLSIFKDYKFIYSPKFNIKIFSLKLKIYHKNLMESCDSGLMGPTETRNLESYENTHVEPCKTSVLESCNMRFLEPRDNRQSEIKIFGPYEKNILYVIYSEIRELQIIFEDQILLFKYTNHWNEKVYKIPKELKFYTRDQFGDILLTPENYRVELRDMRRFKYIFDNFKCDQVCHNNEIVWKSDGTKNVNSIVYFRKYKIIINLGIKNLYYKLNSKGHWIQY
ncbi:SfiI-subtelomeric fragment related protein family member, putative [Theileria annulata]|uniref:SfiI-subtelomeric related protein family member, putative n=1 Tax=Theileria annulata TaxID=5874 RepID=Q4UFJ4_THEAN|nr:SfiI-subtelomeric fragment related protein family member, putative [Theileria annulata]CAI74122.1 SfiI-subtelomeric fragment related protein family member, putative [Theileria annulata]